VEFGYCLEEIVRTLIELNGDILLLQEVDMNCRRSGSVDVAAEIACAVGLAYVYFVCEMSIGKIGAHGNAIVSRFPIVESWPHVMPSGRTKSVAYRRNSVSACACARIETPIGRVVFHSAHLDAYFSGIRGRVKQWDSIVASIQARRATSQQQQQQQQRRDGGEKEGPPFCVVAGDFNTMAHGYRRLVPSFCCDDLRFYSLGWSEEEWWLARVLPSFPGWTDPSAGQNLVTLDILHGWLSADKLDWMLLFDLQLDKNTTFRTGARNYASDHGFLCMDLVPKHDDGAQLNQ